MYICSPYALCDALLKWVTTLSLPLLVGCYILLPFIWQIFKCSPNFMYGLINVTFHFNKTYFDYKYELPFIFFAKHVYNMRTCYNYREFFLTLLISSRRLVHHQLRSAHEFCQRIGMPDGRSRLEWWEVINLWTAWRHYVSGRAVPFMRGSLCFVSSRQQLSSPLAICSRLQLVSSVVVLVRYTLVTLHLCMTPMWNTDLTETVGENFVVNFVMKEFAADKQFTILWINLDRRDS
jgi:hypothetical protein